MKESKSLTEITACTTGHANSFLNLTQNKVSSKTKVVVGAMVMWSGAGAGEGSDYGKIFPGISAKSKAKDPLVLAFFAASVK